MISLLLYSGLGWLFVKFTFIISSLTNFRLIRKQSVVVKEIVEFGKELDLIWENSKQYYSFIAVRNSEYLKTLYSDKKFINRATKGVYEFGSVFKTFTIAAGFNEKLI